MAKITFETAEANNTLIAQSIPVGHLFRTADYAGDSWLMRVFPTAPTIKAADMDTKIEYIFAVDVSNGTIHIINRSKAVVAASKVSFKAIL